MKKSLRKLYIDERKNLSDKYKAESGKEIEKKFLSTEEYKNSSKIFIYINMKNEAPTVGIIKQALKDGKKVAVPVTLTNREMFFVYIDGLDNLVKTKIGVYDPKAERKDEALPDEQTLLAVPGVAFDIEGKRMGYGGGYHDTYIEKYDVKNTVALAFDMQIKESIPTEKHDKAMKLIITEKSIIGGKGNEQID